MARVRPYETIRFEKRGAVAVVTLDRPESLNAYNVAMRDDLFAAHGGLVRTWRGVAFQAIFAGRKSA